MRDLSAEAAQEWGELGHDVADALEAFPAPTVAAVNGYAFGGGCEMALACDLRVAAESALIGNTEIDLGIIPGWGATQRLPRLVGDETARRMIFLGERLDADSAAEAGCSARSSPMTTSRASSANWPTGSPHSRRSRCEPQNRLLIKGSRAPRRAGSPTRNAPSRASLARTISAREWRRSSRIAIPSSSDSSLSAVVDSPGQHDTVVEPVDVRELERRKVGDEPLAVGQRRGVAAADDRRADEHP